MDGKPCPVALVQNARGTKHLILREVWTKLLHESGTMRNLQRRVRRCYGRTSHPFKACGMLLRARLVKLGGTSSKGTPPTLISLAALIKATKQMSFPSALVDALDALQSNRGVALHAATASAMHWNAGSSTDPGPLPMSDPQAFPRILGEQGQAVELKARHRYGLETKAPALASSQMLTLQLDSLNAWTQPLVDMDRGTGPLRSSSRAGLRKDCMLFLGYVHCFYGVVHPNLHHLADADLVGKYISSRLRRGDVALSSWVESAIRVVAWLSSTASQDERTYLNSMRFWLSQLPRLLRKACPARKGGLGRQVVPIGEAVALLHVLTQKKAALEAQCTSLPRLSHAQARSLHDVALACTLFGWLPPQRGQVLMSMLPPWHAQRCPHPDCKDAVCSGNSLRTTADPARLRLQLPHHKTDKTWGKLEFVLPPDLSALLQLYLDKGCRVLRNELGVDHPFMFMAKDGKQLSNDGGFTTYWKGLLRMWGLTERGPHALRHAFVCLHMQSASRGANSQAGFAFCMGHSHQEWERTYDLLSLQRAGQQAVDAMPAWRQAIMASHVSTQVPQVPVAAAHAVGDDLPAEGSETVGSDDGDTSVSGQDELELELSDDGC